MKSKRVVVLGAQVPFVRGGAERLVDSLVHAINDRLEGVQAELVQLPFKWYPERQLLKDMAAWRLIDLSETNGNPIDLCIATKFPTYLAQHANKVTWLVHQHRVFYDLEGSEFDVPHDLYEDALVRKKVRGCDARYLSESRAIYSISMTVSDRLSRFNNLPSETVYPPPPLVDRIRPGPYGDYILYIGRVERIKRIEPLLDAAALLPRLSIVIVGTGEHVKNLQSYAEQLGVAERCHFQGYVNDEKYLSLLSGARGVYYSPIDEDYGFATVEALLARKPVITLEDSGEVARIIHACGGGLVARPSTEELAANIDTLLSMDNSQLGIMMEDGYCFACGITWDNVFDKLITPHL